MRSWPRELSISVDRVKSHVKAVLHKRAARDRAPRLAIVLTEGLVNQEPQLLVPAAGRDRSDPHAHPTGAARRSRAPRAAWRTSQRDPLRRRMLAVADVASALVVCAAVSMLSADLGATILSLVFVPAWVLIAKALGLYDRDHRCLRHLTVDELPSLLAWALTGTAALMLVLAARPVESFVQVFLAVFGAATLAAFALRASARFLWRRITPRERTLIVGNGRLAKAAQRKLELFPDIHASLIGIVPVDVAMGKGKPSAEWLRDVDRVILASSTIREQFLSDLLAACRESQTKLSVVPPLRSMFGTASRLSHVSELPVVEYNTWDVSRSTLVLKRALDLSVALVAVIVLLPVAVLVALAIRLDGHGPIIFRQLRAGQQGRPFQMYKFRTMVPDAEARLSEVVSLERLREPMFKLKRDPRVTHVGRVLRRTSIDELPQLVNVLKGQMSLVGPRPEQVDLVERYGPEHRFRLTVKPGITGPMQVFGRANLTFEERLAVERDYIENLSFGRDFRILGMTIAAVFSRQGAF